MKHSWRLNQVSGKGSELLLSFAPKAGCRWHGWGRRQRGIAACLARAHKPAWGCLAMNRPILHRWRDEGMTMCLDGAFRHLDRVMQDISQMPFQRYFPGLAAATIARRMVLDI
ncbi:hypothetical protein [Pseudomonas sp. RW10S2]|uniref:hypothetical protein n=1 Tax=Pseudomonas sp. RW10S2 TaxID=459637 RepID=UPI0016470B2F|nr:hypothetical protein [Pseudomonas sp. RW10S2]MBC3468249.1 hypothetical protein [Pseudomonas sp. RW10S2]